MSTEPERGRSHEQKLRSVLQVNVTVLVCLAGGIFAAAEASPLSALTIPLAVLALFITDRQERFALTGPWANVLGLAGVAAALLEFIGGGIEARLLAFGHLLVYLTWVLLFQDKQRTQYWWLCALAVLQVATSSVLTQAMWFGPSLLVFVITALWTLSVFSLDRAVVQSRRVIAAKKDVVPTTPQLASASVGTVDGAQRAGIGASASRNSLNNEAGQQLIDWRFIGGVAVCAALSMVVSALFFALTPRVWVDQFRIFSDTPLEAERPLTGFTDQVRLGDLGEILENADLVMQVAMFDAATSAPIDPDRYALSSGRDAPLFRGVVLDMYDKGRWSPPETLVDRRSERPSELRRIYADLVRQEITLQPIGTRTLFLLDPGLTCVEERESSRTGIRRDLVTGVFRRSRMRDEEPTSRPFSYVGYSWKPGRGEGTSAWPVFDRDEFMALYRRRLTRLPSGLDRLRELTTQIASAEAGQPELTPAEVASRCESYLRDSGQFSYTLSLSIQDPTIDPVEDFLFNRKQGHCEYFASALALMLRSAGIPTRLISGFKGGDLNPDTGQYEVRQLHAHAWVEARVDNEWIVLDPTPAGRAATVQALSSTGNYLWTDYRNRLQSVWSNLTALTPQRQKAYFYDPAMNTAQRLMAALQGQGAQRSVLNDLRSFLRSPRQWISWKGGVAAFVLGLLLLAFVAGGLRLIRWLRHRLRSPFGGGRGRHRVVVPFFERFCRIARQAGSVRAPQQTQLEHAEHFAQLLSEPLTRQSAGWNASHLVDAFYRVRFGSEEIPDAESAELDGQLDHLEQWLNNGGRRHVTS